MSPIMQLKKILLSMATFGNIAVTREYCAKLAGGYWRRSMITLDSLSASVIERRRKCTHMVKNRIPDCKVVVYFRRAACLTIITKHANLLRNKGKKTTFGLIDHIPVISG